MPCQRRPGGRFARAKRGVGPGSQAGILSRGSSFSRSLSLRGATRLLEHDPTHCNKTTAMPSVLVVECEVEMPVAATAVHVQHLARTQAPTEVAAFQIKATHSPLYCVVVTPPRTGKAGRRYGTW